MKKIISGALAVLLAAGLIFSGCGKETPEPEEPFSAESVEAPSSEEAAAPSAKYGKTTSKVNFRESADKSSMSQFVMDANTVVDILSFDGEWYHVVSDGREGYIYMDYLVELDEVPAQESVEEAVSVADVPEEPAQPAEETAAPAPAPAPIAGITKNAADTDGNLVSLGLYDAASLPNNSVPYGCDWESKDEKGLPQGVHWYESLYGKYKGIYYINTDEKLIYLTMDEGYEAGYTPAILDTLKEKNVHVVFFITKQFFDSNPELIQRMIDEGHIIGNHTCRHPAGGYPNYANEHGIDSFVEDVLTLHKLVYDRFGYSMKLFRFPEGEASEMTMAVLNNLGYISVFWSYAHKDYAVDDQPPAEVTLERCVNHMGSGSIYLLHAVSQSNTAALGAFIDQARAAGYDFGTFPVEELSIK